MGSTAAAGVTRTSAKSAEEKTGVKENDGNKDGGFRMGGMLEQFE
jgi:hypothetical protein